MRTTVTRRRFVATTAAGVALTALPAVATRARAQGKNELVFVGFGGTYQEGQTKALFEPFTKETGIKVVQTTGVDLAKLRAQVQSKNVEWDLISIPDRLRYTAVRDVTQGGKSALSKVPVRTRAVIPALIDAQGLAAIPHTGYMRADVAAIEGLSLALVQFSSARAGVEPPDAKL